MRKLLSLMVVGLFFLPYKITAQQHLFVINNDTALYDVDVENCTKKLIGYPGSFGDITFTPNGKLWGLSQGLVEINPLNGSTTVVGPGLVAASLEALDDSTLIAESGQKLFKISTKNGQVTYLDTIGYQSIGDLIHLDKAFYMTGYTPGGSALLVKILLNSNATSTISVTQVGNVTHTCMALGSATLSGTVNHILGFRANPVFGYDMVKICPYDGSYSVLCPGLFPEDPYGAASFYLPLQNPEPVSCNGPVGFNSTTAQKQTSSVSPNPFSQVINLIPLLDVQDNIYSVLIKDSFGRIVYERVVLTQNTLDLSSLQAGVYVLFLSHGNDQEQFKILKE